jgi:hypothetical protein
LRTKSAAAKLPAGRLHLGVARLLQQQRQPADLELGAGADDEVGVARARDQARLGLDLVRVLQALVATETSTMLPPSSWTSAPHSGSQANTRSAASAGMSRAGAALPAPAEGIDACSWLLRGGRKSVAVRAVRAQAHLVLKEDLPIGQPFARRSCASCRRSARTRSG